LFDHEAHCAPFLPVECSRPSRFRSWESRRLLASAVLLVTGNTAQGLD
jgi:hypothetical protein